ncbi:MAG TPA: hypothetical protein DEG69_16070, partial [Flavobacteriaceae bacterium]|nr:hypothetical protein [Flavobacteriaceae bacterium]
EILTAENDIAKFRQNGNQLIGINRDEKMRPLYTKIGEALDKVVKAEGYTQILTTGNNSLAYFDDSYDVTILVLKELGITVTEE